jgi:hypothetical protein
VAFFSLSFYWVSSHLEERHQAFTEKLKNQKIQEGKTSDLARAFDEVVSTAHAPPGVQRTPAQNELAVQSQDGMENLNTPNLEHAQDLGLGREREPHPVFSPVARSTLAQWADSPVGAFGLDLRTTDYGPLYEVASETASAAQLGIQPGDLICGLGAGASPSNEAELKEALERSTHRFNISVCVRRNGQELRWTVPLQEPEAESHGSEL